MEKIYFSSLDGLSIDTVRLLSAAITETVFQKHLVAAPYTLILQQQSCLSEPLICVDTVTAAWQNVTAGRQLK